MEKPNEIRKVTAYETFSEVDDIRWFEKVKIEVDFPFSEVTFEESDFDIASQIVSLQFLGGYNENDDKNRSIFLNNIKIENKELYIWENDDFTKKFIEKNKSKLKKNNKFTIEIKNKNQLNYIKQTIIT